jgi:hypothetical protein
VSNVLEIMQKEEKKQYSQHPDQDSNCGHLKIQRRNAAVEAKFSVPNYYGIHQYDVEQLQLIAS